MATQKGDEKTWQRWQDISKRDYTRVLELNPTCGRLFHHLAILTKPRTQVTSDKDFEASVSQLFYYTKSLVVENPFPATRESILSLIFPLVARAKEDEKSASVPLTPQHYFLSAVCHVILPSLGPKILRRIGYSDEGNDHVQTVYAALEQMTAGGSANISKICPTYVLNNVPPSPTNHLQPATRPIALSVATWDSPGW